MHFIQIDKLLKCQYVINADAFFYFRKIINKNKQLPDITIC